MDTNLQRYYLTVYWLHSKEFFAEARVLCYDMLVLFCLQVLRTLPLESIHAVLDEQSSLWKELKPHELAKKVLELPDVFVKAWLCFFEENNHLDLREAELPLSQTLRLIRSLPANPELQVLHVSCMAEQADSTDGSLCVLDALNQDLSKMPNIVVLGIHRLQVRAKHLKTLSTLCDALKGNLTGLGLSLRDWQFDRDMHGKELFFQAIARLNNLKVLALPQWDRFVGQDHTVISPLRRLDPLKVLVHESTGLSAAQGAQVVAPGLSFFRADSRRFKS